MIDESEIEAKAGTVLREEMRQKFAKEYVNEGESKSGHHAAREAFKLGPEKMVIFPRVGTWDSRISRIS